MRDQAVIRPPTTPKSITSPRGPPAGPPTRKIWSPCARTTTPSTKMTPRGPQNAAAWYASMAASPGYHRGAIPHASSPAPPDHRIVTHNHLVLSPRSHHPPAPPAETRPWPKARKSRLPRGEAAHSACLCTRLPQLRASRPSYLEMDLPTECRSWQDSMTRSDMPCSAFFR